MVERVFIISSDFAPHFNQNAIIWNDLYGEKPNKCRAGSEKPGKMVSIFLRLIETAGILFACCLLAVPIINRPSEVLPRIFVSQPICCSPCFSFSADF